MIGVLLSGRLADGTAGLRAIRQRGGVAVVRDPADAEHPEMSRSALAHVDVDGCGAELADTLLRLVGGSLEHAHLATVTAARPNRRSRA